MTINADSSCPPTTRVSNGGWEITYREHTFYVHSWRNGLKALQDRVEETIKRLTLNSDHGLVIPEDIPDDWADLQRGYSWTNNFALFMESRPLLQAYMDRDAESGTFFYFEGDESVVPDIQKMRRFLKEADDLNQMLSLLVFLAAGQPPRGSEFVPSRYGDLSFRALKSGSPKFVSYRYANGLRGRNMFITGGSVWFATRRTKTENLTGREAFFPAKCYALLSKLLQLYLLLIRPLEMELSYYVHGKESYLDYSEFLWMKNGKCLTPSMFYQAITDFLENSCGVQRTLHSKPGIRAYRQFVVELGRVFLGCELDIEEEEEDDALALQMGHNLHRARTYAVEVGSLPNMSSDLLGRYEVVSERWWAVTGIGCVGSPLLPIKDRRQITRATYRTGGIPLGPSSADFLGNDESRERFSQVELRLDQVLQRLNGDLNNDMRRAVAEGIVSVNSLCGPNIPIQHHLTSSSHTVQSSTLEPLVPMRPSTFHQDSSTAWIVNSPDQPWTVDPLPGDTNHDIDMERPDPTLLANLPAGHRQLAIVHKGPPERESPSALVEQSQESYLSQLLQQYFDNPEAKFRSEMQKRAVMMSLANKHSFVAVLPTGAGKSLVYNLPASTGEVGRPFVVCPFKALLDDQVEKANEHGLSPHRWTVRKSNIPKESKIVFVPLESAASPHIIQ